MPGDKVITLAEDVDFAVGDQLVITASEMGAGVFDAEQVEVAAVLSKRSFRITQPLENMHRSSW
jgi:hypothetical protein